MLVINGILILFGYFDHVVQHTALDVQVTISYLVFANAINDHMRLAHDVTRAQTSCKWIRGNKQLSTSFSSFNGSAKHLFNEFSYLCNNNRHKHSQNHVFAMIASETILLIRCLGVRCAKLILSMLDIVRTKSCWMNC